MRAARAKKVAFKIKTLWISTGKAERQPFPFLFDFVLS